MNKIIFPFLFVLITMLYSCNHQSKQEAINNFNVSEKSKYEAACNIAAKSEVILDTIFMGLRFGMTEKEVNDHLRNMLDDGKLETNGLGAFQYSPTVDKNSTLKSTMSAEFFNGQLYKFTLLFHEYAIGGLAIPVDDQFLANKAKSLFLRKYKINKDNFNAYYYTMEGLGMFSCFINKNMIVEFNPLGSMSYINAPVSKQKNDYESKKEQQNIKESISDL